MAGLPFDRVVLSGIVQVSEKLHPQDFFHGFWTVCVYQHAVGMCALLFARRAQSSSAEDVVGPKRRKRAVVIAVFERGKARVRRQYVQQQSRPSARQSRDVNGRIHRPPCQSALEQLSLQLAHVNPKIRMRMHQPAEKTQQPRLIKIHFHSLFVLLNMNINALRQAQDRIAEAIKALKKTRNEHEDYLKPIETRTRQLLIDLMLEALGWDVRNPAQVHLEYKGTSGKPDYALFSHGNVVALIEAKKLEIPLARIKVEQVIKYARDKALTSLKYVVWTNGYHWQIWSIEEDREESFQLSNTQEYECAAKAMQLLRSALEVQEMSSTPKPSRVHETIDPANNGDWEPLTSLKVKRGQKLPTNTNIKFPDSSTKPLKHWTDMLAFVAEYLVKTGKISAQIGVNPSTVLVSTNQS